MTAAPSAFDPKRLDVISSAHYERDGYPFRDWAWVRKHDPVLWVEHPELRPVLGDHEARRHHRDLEAAGALPERAATRGLLERDPAAARGDESATCSTWIRPITARTATSPRSSFTPRAVPGWAAKVERITREVLDAAAAKGQGDFVADISAPITIAVIAEMLGVPASDGALLFRWTNEMIAPEDPEFQRGGRRRGDARAGAHRALRVLRRDVARAPRSGRRTTSSASSRTAASTASRCRPSSCSRTTSCSSSPATRRRATR